jgi:hypothetical protein
MIVAAVLGQELEMGQLESQVANLLQHRFGDGLVYLPKNQPHTLYQLAVSGGYVDQEGYLTRKGRVLLARHQ